MKKPANPPELPLLAFGNLVRQTRSQKGLTQLRAARGAGISRKHWAAIEQGQNVSAVYMMRVASYLDLSVIPLGSDLRAMTQDGSGVDVSVLFALADEILTFATTIADKLRAIAIDAALPPSERTRDADAIAAFVDQTSDISDERSTQLSRAFRDLATAKPVARKTRVREASNHMTKQRKAKGE